MIPLVQEVFKRRLDVLLAEVLQGIMGVDDVFVVKLPGLWQRSWCFCVGKNFTFQRIEASHFLGILSLYLAKGVVDGATLGGETFGYIKCIPGVSIIW